MRKKYGKVNLMKSFAVALIILAMKIECRILAEKLGKENFVP